MRQTLAFGFLSPYRSGVLQVKTTLVGLSSHLHHINWSNTADTSRTALVSASGSQIRIGAFASQKRGKMLGWNKRCCFMGSPSKGCLETAQSQERTLAPPITALVLQWASCKGRLLCHWARLPLMQSKKEQNSSSPLLGLAKVVQAALDWALAELIMKRGRMLSGICSPSP